MSSGHGSLDSKGARERKSSWSVGDVLHLDFDGDYMDIYIRSICLLVCVHFTVFMLCLKENKKRHTPHPKQTHT